MPEQIKRLIIPFALAIAALIVARYLLVPKTFGIDGHYREAAVGENAALKINYAGQSACAMCHDDIFKKKEKAAHKGVACEACHGPSEAHVEDPGTVKPYIPKARGDKCLLCHEYLAARPTGFPQIVEKLHNPGRSCIVCHNPHAPDPKVAISECSACHAKIAREKSVSPHASLACTVCHSVPAGHKSKPRLYPPTKPSDRDFCGKCHSQGSNTDKGIAKIDPDEHHTRYLCWECHYQHQPE